jgi:hypothetical protein
MHGHIARHQRVEDRSRGRAVRWRDNDSRAADFRASAAGCGDRRRWWVDDLRDA